MAAESTLSPPAPLDLGRMEMEAKETAKKHIANLLQVLNRFENESRLTLISLQCTGGESVRLGTLPL